jgi:t-SNARE complex subunit (syntaxin)
VIYDRFGFSPTLFSVAFLPNLSAATSLTAKGLHHRQTLRNQAKLQEYIIIIIIIIIIVVPMLN